MNKSIVVLISGRGSNLKALLGSNVGKAVGLVIANRPDVLGLQIAKEFGVKSLVVNHNLYQNRQEFEDELLAQILPQNPRLIVLAGFMRVLTSKFIYTFAGKLINIHPSLLPNFPGLHTHKQAINAGVKIHGCTVHFVDEGVDSGKIIAQGAVPVLVDDDEEKLGQRVLNIEHKILPMVVSKYLDKEFYFDQHKQKVVWDKSAKATVDNEFLIVPSL